MLRGGELRLFERSSGEGDQAASSGSSEPSLASASDLSLNSSFPKNSSERIGIFNRLFGSEAPKVELARKIRRTIPPGVSVHRILNYYIRGRSELSNKSGLSLLIVRCSSTPKARSSLVRWKKRFESEHAGKVKVITEEVQDRSSVLRRLSGELADGVVRRGDLGIVQRFISKMQRVAPVPKRISELDWGIKRDFSHLEFVAVDGPGTRDREDLICAEIIPGSKRLRLHVAFIDVTPYLYPGSPLDKYACGVGMSIYGIKSKIRTLGAEASEDEFSFVQGERRPAWVVSMDITLGGKITRSKLRRAVVMNHRSFDPESASQEVEEMGTFAPSLMLSYQAAERLFQRRLTRAEAVRLDSSSIQGVLIGESMVAAKSVIAEKLRDSGVPAVFRNHELASQECLSQLASELSTAGIKVTGEQLSDPVNVAQVLEYLNINRAFELQKRIIDLFVARSTYSPRCRGHAAIGVETYAEIKGRDAVGILNQMQLRSIRDHSYPRLSRQEVARRSFARNRQGERMGNFIYEIMTLDRLHEVLSGPERLYSASIDSNDGRIARISVDELGIEGVVKNMRADTSSVKDQNLMVKLVGYSIPTRQWIFERSTKHETIPKESTLEAKSAA